MIPGTREGDRPEHRVELRVEPLVDLAGLLDDIAGALELGKRAVLVGSRIVERVRPEVWDVLEEIPNDSAAALILIEHQWAVPLRDDAGAGTDVVVVGHSLGGFTAPLVARRLCKDVA